MVFLMPEAKLWISLQGQYLVMLEMLHALFFFAAGAIYGEVGVSLSWQAQHFMNFLDPTMKSPPAASETLFVPSWQRSLYQKVQ